MFIYVLVDPRDGDIRYVGASTDPHKRYRQHVKDLRRSDYRTAWIKKLLRLGLQPILRMIQEVPSDVCDEAERYWIKTLRDLGCRITNGTAGGTGLVAPSAEVRARMSTAQKALYASSAEFRERHAAKNRGRFPSKETRKKLSDTLKLIWNNPEAREAQSRRAKGRVNSPEHRAKLSAIHKGRPKTAEHREKISRILTGRPTGRPMPLEHKERLRQISKERVVREETRAKMSLAKKGKRQSPEHYARVAIFMKNRPISEETRRKLSASLTGRKLSPEHCEKMRQSRLGQAPTAAIAANKGKKQSAEVIAKRSAAMKGRLVSPETREKLRQANLGKKQSDVFRQNISLSNKEKLNRIQAAHPNCVVSWETIGEMTGLGLDRCRYFAKTIHADPLPIKKVGRITICDRTELTYWLKRFKAAYGHSMKEGKARRLSAVEKAFVLEMGKLEPQPTFKGACNLFTAKFGTQLTGFTVAKLWRAAELASKLDARRKKL